MFNSSTKLRKSNSSEPPMTNEKFMEIAMDEAKVAVAQKDGPPIGAIITRNNRFVASGHDETLKEGDITCHAEMVVVRNACKNLNVVHLENCILYVNVEPCPMCIAACVSCGIKSIYYAITAEEFAKIHNCSQFSAFPSIAQIRDPDWRKSFMHQLLQKEACDVLKL